MAILLCTMQGEPFLEEQLASLAAQTFRNWRVWASDDGSRDRTVSILETFQHAWGQGRLTILQGPGRGFAANFLSLATRSDIQAAYYAFADQDDLWEPGKLEQALNWLTSVPSDVPALYCGRTRLISETGQDLGLSPLFSRPASFANALVQSIGGGNTMVFNHAARMLVMEAGQVDVVTHDWWLYLLVSSCGGTVWYDPEPRVRYRQHADNLVGSNADWGARLYRIRMLFEGRFKGWNDRHIQALQGMRHRMTENSLRVLDVFSAARQETGLIARLAGLRSAGVYRQTVMGNLGLFLAASAGKV